MKPANENPWYCVATLYGEQCGGEVDRSLLERNRQGWDHWRSGRPEEISDAFKARIALPGTPMPDRTERADFTFTHFEAPFVFQGYQSIQNMDFSSSKFSNYADFSGTVFSKVSFASATFLKRATLTYAKFMEDADFSLVKFSDSVVFSPITFSKSTTFASATFSSADFRSAQFAYLDLSLAKFLENADFRSAVFSQYANFSSATFLNADFSSARFGENADFTSATFEANAHFKSATFANDTNFRTTIFLTTADFVNAKFESITVFAGAKFKRQVPDFRGAKLHEATEWDSVEWPPQPSDKVAAQAQVYGYERLKQEMERLKKHEDEQAFFTKELRARRETYSLWSDKLLNRLYELSSNYGQSVVRPLLWLFLLFVFGTVLFAAVPISKGVEHLSLDRAAGFSFANIFSFLQKREMWIYSGAAQAIGAVEAIAGVVLLFLLGLALRNKFRMK